MLNKNIKVMKNEKVSSKSEVLTNNTLNSIRSYKKVRTSTLNSNIPVNNGNKIKIQSINNKRLLNNTSMTRYNDIQTNKSNNLASNINISDSCKNINDKNFNYNKDEIQKTLDNNSTKYNIKNEQLSNINFPTSNNNIKGNAKYNKALSNNISTSNINKTMENGIHNKKHHKNNIAQIVKIKKLSSNATIPIIGTNNSAGYDLVACIDKDIIIQPNEIILVPTGIAIEIPNGYFGMVCSRSGLACKYGIYILNAPGIIDSDYRGEIKCILHNCSNNAFILKNGTKMAQLLIMKHEIVNWIETDNLSDTNRGTNGFGSTGI